MKNKKEDSWKKFASLGITSTAYIGIMTYLGYQLDQYWGLKIPWMTITAICLSTLGVIYRLYLSLTNKK